MVIKLSSWLKMAFLSLAVLVVFFSGLYFFGKVESQAAPQNYDSIVSLPSICEEVKQIAKYKITFSPSQMELEPGESRQLTVSLSKEKVSIPPDGTVLRKKGDYKVWWMEEGKRRWITTMEVFNKMAKDLGFTSNDILIIQPGWEYDPTRLEDIPEGKPIEDWPEPEEDIIKMIFAYFPMSGGKLSLAKQLGFNTMQAYPKSNAFWKEQLDIAASLGMRCLITLPDNATATEVKNHVLVHKNHKALWGWLTFDDADYRCALGHWTKDDMRRVYNLVKKYDEKHPVAVSACHGASGQDHDWNKYLAFDAFDVLFYELYAYRDSIPEPEKWLKWMFDRLADYAQLQEKRIVPIVPTFERGIFDDPTGKIWPVYEMARERLGRKSCAMYDWDGIVARQKYRLEVKRINQDK